MSVEKRDFCRLKEFFTDNNPITVVATIPEDPISSDASSEKRLTFEFHAKELDGMTNAKTMPITRTIGNRYNTENPFSGKTLKFIEKMAIEDAISLSKGSIPKAARTLGVSPSTIYRKLESWR